MIDAMEPGLMSRVNRTIQPLIAADRINDDRNWPQSNIRKGSRTGRSRAESIRRLRAIYAESLAANWGEV